MSELLERIPPQNIEAEQAALGAMLLEKSAIVRAEPTLRPEDFYRDAHRWIYRGILHLYRHKQAVDLITLGEWLKSHAASGKATVDDNLLAQVGGTLYLTTLMESAPTAAGIGHYAGIVREKAIQRRLIGVADLIMEGAYRGEEDLDAFIREKAGALLQAGEVGARRETHSIGEASYTVYESMFRAAKEGRAAGVKTGWQAINGIIRPITPGQLVIIAADTGCGKTAFATNWAINLAEEGRRGLIFSLEMEDTDLSLRALLEKTTFTQDDFDTLHEAEEEQQNRVLDSLHEAVGRLWELPLKIDDAPDTSIGTIDAAIQYEISEGRRPDFVIVDYLQLLNVEHSTRSRYLDVGNLSKALKGMAKTYRLMIVALCQLGTKDLAKRKNRRPQMDDIYESGKIVQDADVLVTLYWPSRYGKDEMKTIGLPDNEVAKCAVEVNVLKGRYGTKRGSTAGTKLYYNGPHYSFRDLTSDEWKVLYGRKAAAEEN